MFDSFPLRSLSKLLIQVQAKVFIICILEPMDVVKVEVCFETSSFTRWFVFVVSAIKKGLEYNLKVSTKRVTN